jgi:S1-C subfamily serine protease
MLAEEKNVFSFEEYAFPYQPISSAPVGVLDAPPAAQMPAGPDMSQPPVYPPGPEVSSTPKRRPRRLAAIIFLTLVIALIFGVGLFSGWQFAHSSASTATSTATTTPVSSSTGTTLESLQEAAIAKIEPAVVELKVTTAQGEQIGSGVIIDSNGDIVTNNHVVSGGQTIDVVLSNGNTEQAQLIGTDAADDLAVVRIAPYAHMVVAQIGDSSKLVVGQEVLAVGNPLGITETATDGIVSALNRSVTESTGATIAHAIQTDAAVNPGNSGGALINLQGQLVGIPTLTAIDSETNTTAEGVSFAIPSNLVKTAVQQLIQQSNS